MATNKLVLSACRAYAKHFGTPGTVFYPGCGNDASPSLALPNSAVINLDPVQRGLDEIKAQHAAAITVCAKAEDVPPGARYDLVVDVHSHAPFAARVRDLKRGGNLLVANKTSDDAFDSSEFELVAVMIGTDEDLRVVVDDIEKYVEEDPNAPKVRMHNRRKTRAPFYVFRKK